MSTSWTIVGAGLAGTLLGLELEHRGTPFTIVDMGSGSRSSRVAAGIFNPLLGPRMSPDAGAWDALEPFYRRLELQLGVSVFHPLRLERPLKGSRVTAEDFPRSGPGWSARAENGIVLIDGGGWLDIPQLLDAARTRWLSQGLLTQASLSTDDARGRQIIWCGGLDDFQGSWADDPLTAGRWQGVRGDILTVEAPQWGLSSIWIGSRFLLPLGGGLYRWGATHHIDDCDLDERPEVRQLLERELQEHCQQKGLRGTFPVIDHQWGIRPVSRTLHPLVGRHATESGWRLFNGFAGKGVTAIARALDSLIALL